MAGEEKFNWLCNLTEELKISRANETQQLSAIKKLENDKHLMEKKLSLTMQVVGAFWKSLPRSTWAILLLLDWIVHELSVDKQKAYDMMQDQYNEAKMSPLTLPSFENLEALRLKLSSWYSENTLPCFIQTICKWYNGKSSNVPFYFFGFNPEVQKAVLISFVQEHFFILFEGQRKELYEDRYVLCYEVIRGEGHMCVVSKDEVHVFTSDNPGGWKYTDSVLQKDIEQNNIERFYLCLPRGDMSNIEGTYKIAEVSTLQQLTALQLSEPEYRMKITHKNSPHEFEWKKTSGQSCDASWSSFIDFRTPNILVEVYLDKGKSPFP